MPVVGQVVEQRPELVLAHLHLLGEPSVVVDSGDAGSSLGIELPLAPQGTVGLAADVPSQRATVQVREVLDVVEMQAVSRHQRVDRRAREVAVVLVVDGVELDVLDEIAHVRVLDREQPVVGEQRREPADEVIEVGDVRHDVVGDDYIGRPMIVADRERAARRRRSRRSSVRRSPRRRPLAPARRRCPAPAHRQQRRCARDTRRCSPPRRRATSGPRRRSEMSRSTWAAACAQSASEKDE